MKPNVDELKNYISSKVLDAFANGYTGDLATLLNKDYIIRKISTFYGELEIKEATEWQDGDIQGPPLHPNCRC